ncbi:MAG: hypothetical protein M3332_14105 [Actinomycetota bacterium]|jgi:hypothetical protein|nr:hypothetical protein [Actinomycetota bacterium]
MRCARPVGLLGRVGLAGAVIDQCATAAGDANTGLSTLRALQVTLADQLVSRPATVAEAVAK